MKVTVLRCAVTRLDVNKDHVHCPEHTWPHCVEVSSLNADLHTPLISTDCHAVHVSVYTLLFRALIYDTQFTNIIHIMALLDTLDRKTATSTFTDIQNTNDISNTFVQHLCTKKCTKVHVRFFCKRHDSIRYDIIVSTLLYMTHKRCMARTNSK